jgi:CIC family chloride channel protein
MIAAGQTKASYLYLLKWLALSVSAGVVGSLTVKLFTTLLERFSAFFIAFALPLPVWSLAGALLVGALIYRLEPAAAGEGIPSYLRGVNLRQGYLSFSVTFFKFWSALFTLATFGNGGVVGPVGRVSAGIMSKLGRSLRYIGFDEEDHRTAVICGMAAAVAVIFNTPLGGGIFAVEITQRSRVGYKDFFPAILAGIVAVLFNRFLGWSPYYLIHASDNPWNLRLLGWILLLAVLTGLVSGAYTRFYALIARLFRRNAGRVLLKVTAGTLVASWIGWLINPALMGTSKALFQAVFSGNLVGLTGRLGSSLPLGVVLLIMLVLKGVLNCLTVGSGMSAGFTGPAALMGILLAAGFAHLVGIPVLSTNYYALIAAGFAGMLAGSMNVPLAAAVMSIEIFGLSYSIPAGLAAIIAFQINRYQTIYDFAFEDIRRTREAEREALP